jgi:hypothetical protein
MTINFSCNFLNANNSLTAAYGFTFPKQAIRVSHFAIKVGMVRVSNPFIFGGVQAAASAGTDCADHLLGKRIASAIC